MVNTSYHELADSLFNKIKDYDFISMDEQAAYEIVINYIRPAIVQFENCKQDLSDRDDESLEFNFRLTDNTFEMLVNYMVIEWLTSNYILTGQALKARMSTADFHALNQYQNLGKLMELRDGLLAENKQLAINKSYKDSNLFTVLRKKVSL